MPFKGADLLAVQTAPASGRRPQFSVMVLNCDTLDWDIDTIVGSLDNDRISYEQLVYQMALVKTVRADIGAEWNALEHFSAHETAILHFTNMSTQPWVAKENPLGYLWVGELVEAIEGGALSKEFLKQEVAKGHVRPSLLYQVEHRIDDSLLLPQRVAQLDAEFVPPYRSLPTYRKSRSVFAVRRLRALFRRCQGDRADRFQRIFYDWFYR
jgi:hypothetical protein